VSWVEQLQTTSTSLSSTDKQIAPNNHQIEAQEALHDKIQIAKRSHPSDTPIGLPRYLELTSFYFKMVSCCFKPKWYTDYEEALELVD
jgi:hypothetical protein